MRMTPAPPREIAMPAHERRLDTTSPTRRSDGRIRASGASSASSARSDTTQAVAAASLSGPPRARPEEHELRVPIEVATAPNLWPQHRDELSVEETESHPGILPPRGDPRRRAEFG